MDISNISFEFMDVKKDSLNIDILNIISFHQYIYNN